MSASRPLAISVTRMLDPGGRLRLGADKGTFTPAKKLQKAWMCLTTEIRRERAVGWLTRKWDGRGWESARHKQKTSEHADGSGVTDGEDVLFEPQVSQLLSIEASKTNLSIVPSAASVSLIRRKEASGKASSTSVRSYPKHGTTKNGTDQADTEGSGLLLSSIARRQCCVLREREFHGRSAVSASRVT